MLPWLVLVLVLIVLDQWSKHAILARFVLGERLPINSFFDLVLVYNRGAAFSFLASHDGWQRWLFTGLALVVSAWLSVEVWRHRSQRLLPTACALVIGGALGNVYDRLVHGAVVNFLHFHYAGYSWPAFNLADSAISIGVALMLWAQFRQGRQHSTGNPP